MKNFHNRIDSRVAPRAQRLDPSQASRCSLVLIMLMGMATTLSVMATTQALSSPRPEAAHIILLR